MGKKEFIEKLAVAGNFKKEVAEGIYTVFVETFKAVLSDKTVITIPELGKFEVRHKPPRIARNPKTGEPVSVPEKLVVKYKASKPLNDFLNENTEKQA
jgi:nucleoid DNA-binding protein